MIFKLTKHIRYTMFYIGVNIIGLPNVHYHIFKQKINHSKFIK